MFIRFYSIVILKAFSLYSYTLVRYSFKKYTKRIVSFKRLLNIFQSLGIESIPEAFKKKTEFSFAITNFWIAAILYVFIVRVHVYNLENNFCILFCKTKQKKLTHTQTHSLQVLKFSSLEKRKLVQRHQQILCVMDLYCPSF